MKSLSEVVELVGISRRMIQEYEDAGLAKRPTKTNKYGHLLYDKEDIKRLWQLRFYRELDYDKKTIRAFEKDKDEEKKLDNIIESLIKEREKIDHLINVAQGMKEIGLGLNLLQEDLFFDEDIEFDLVFSFLGPMFETLSKNTNMDEIELTENELELIVDTLEGVAGLINDGLSISDDIVQEKVSKLHQGMARRFSDSIQQFKGVAIALTNRDVLGEGIDRDYGEGTIEKCKKAFLYYCEENQNTGIDKKWIDGIEEISKLGLQKKAYSSDEVQAEIEKLYQSLIEIEILNEKPVLDVLHYIATMYLSKPVKKALDKDRERGIGWFIGKSFELFYNTMAVSVYANSKKKLE